MVHEEQEEGAPSGAGWGPSCQGPIGYLGCRPWARQNYQLEISLLYLVRLFLKYIFTNLEREK